MAETIQFTDQSGKVYTIPEDMAKATPVHYANNVQISLTNDGVGLLFSVKLDSLGRGSETDVAVPQVACFISIQQALALAQVLNTGLPALIQEMQRQAATQAGMPQEVVSAA